MKNWLVFCSILYRIVNTCVHYKRHIGSHEPFSNESPWSVLRWGKQHEGSQNAVAKQIQDAEIRAIYMHCYGLSLKLATNDTVKHCKVIKMALETTHEITKLVQYPPRREGFFDKIKGELAPDNPGVHVLCPTRSTVCATSMQSIIQNYSVL